MGAFDEECLPENMLDAQHASSSPVKSISQLGGCLILFPSLLGSKQRRPLSNIKSDHFQTSVGYQLSPFDRNACVNTSQPR